MGRSSGIATKTRIERAMSSFSLDGQRLAYTVHGDGPRLTVLLHGLLFNQRMHETLARALAERGHRVVTLDLLGHGDSDRPREKWRYSMPAFGSQVIALLDHLDEPEAVVLGTSLGANVALEAAVAAPERVRGMVIEMPVLDHALIGCAIAFTPIMIALTAGEPGMRTAGPGRAHGAARQAAVAGRHPARLDPPGPGAERRRLPGPVLRPHGAAAGGAPGDRDADARDRPPVRPHPPVLGRRDAGRGAAVRAAAAGQLAASSCGSRHGG